MTVFNPCYCWSLKDGCITIGIWTLIFSIIELGLFSWQTAVISWERDKVTNRREPYYSYQGYYDGSYRGSSWNQYFVSPEETYYSVVQFALFGWQSSEIYLMKGKAGNERQVPFMTLWKPEFERWPGYYELSWMTPDEKFYTGLFVVQILNLIAAFFLLFASVSLMYGIHVNSKLLIWPWFPCIVATILCSVTYCITWWVGRVSSYWLVLTIIEFLSVIINTYCLFCVIIQYQRVLRGETEEKDAEIKVPVVVWDDHNQKGGSVETRFDTKAYWNKSFESEPSKPEAKVSLYNKEASRYGLAPVYSRETVLGVGGSPPRTTGSVALPETSLTKTQELLVTKSADESLLQSKAESDTAKQASQLSPMTTELVDVIGDDPEGGKMPPSFHRSQSVDLVEREKQREGRSARRKIRHSKSKESVTSRGHHTRYSSSSSESSTAEEEAGRIHRSAPRSRSHSRDSRKVSESDTGYSCSHDSRHSRHKASGAEGAKSSHSHRHHRRPRDVKRENKERSETRATQRSQLQHGAGSVPQLPGAQPYPFVQSDLAGGVRPELGGYGFVPMPVLPASSLPATYSLAQPLNALGSQSRPVTSAEMPVLPPYATSGAITIPQHIVIPSAPGPGRDQQRFQINSEISISYNDRSRPSSSQTNYGTNVPPVIPARPMTASPAPASLTGSRSRLHMSSGNESGGESKTSPPTAL